MFSGKVKYLSRGRPSENMKYYYIINIYAWKIANNLRIKIVLFRYEVPCIIALKGGLIQIHPTVLPIQC